MAEIIIVYRSSVFPDQLFKFDKAYSSIISNSSSWSCHTTQLALDFSVWQRRRYPLWGSWFESFEFSESREHALRVLLVVCMHFPVIKNLFLVIDGRDERFGGSTKIVDASTIAPDYSHHPFRERALEVISSVIKDLHNGRPDIKLPCIKLALLMNGEDNQDWERWWYYDGARCDVRKPGRRRRSFFEAYDSSTDDSDDNVEDVVVSGSNRAEHLDSKGSIVGGMNNSE